MYEMKNDPAVTLLPGTLNTSIKPPLPEMVNPFYIDPIITIKVKIADFTPSSGIIPIDYTVEVVLVINEKVMCNMTYSQPYHWSNVNRSNLTIRFIRKFVKSGYILFQRTFLKKLERTYLNQAPLNEVVSGMDDTLDDIVIEFTERLSNALHWHIV